MKPALEPRRARQATQSFTAYHRVEAEFPFAWHYHAELELTWIEAGSGSRIVGDHAEPYQTGDLVLLGRDLPHTWSSEHPRRRAGAHRAVVVQFSAELFAQGGTATEAEFGPLRDLLRRASRGLAFPAGLARAVQAELLALCTLRGLEAWCALARLLDRLARAPEARPLASPTYVPSPGQGPRRRHERALACIEAQLTDPTLDLPRVARAVHLSPAAFSRFFRRQAGATFVAYLNAARVAHAARLLVETEQSVAAIAFASGFGNLSNFNRRFRAEHGEAPLAYRRRFERDQPPRAQLSRKSARAR
jgi:AraC-like DNA-binding protein